MTDEFKKLDPKWFPIRDTIVALTVLSDDRLLAQCRAVAPTEALSRPKLVRVWLVQEFGETAVRGYEENVLEIAEELFGAVWSEDIRKKLVESFGRNPE